MKLSIDQKKAFVSAIKKWAILSCKPELYSKNIFTCDMCKQYRCSYCPLAIPGAFCCNNTFNAYAEKLKTNSMPESTREAKQVLQFIIQKYKDIR